ncbi:MAG: tandem-95 repeat protein, partial [Gammaproteobacteria bacterium]|nr:tandem-95 repeat protein [Gammaproteobacteria bacterium]
YVDGVAEATDTAVQGSLDGNSGLHTFGAREKSGALSQFFQGSLDEVRIYDLTLSDTEVLALFNGMAPGGNTAPTADARSVSTLRDTPLAITLTGTDSENDPLTFAIATLPSNGTLSGTAPNVTYTPNANYDGADSFTFTVNDGEYTSVAATVSITVNAANTAPEADSQAVSAAKDTPLAITLTGSDPESDPLTFTIATGPSNGTLSGAAPNVTYTPDSGYVGADSFTFTVSDGEFTSAAATVSITVNTANTAPVVNAGPDQTITLPLDTASLDGTITDDGLPDGNLTTLWSMLSGPAAVVFGDATSVDTTATFSVEGQYVLQLSANDGELGSTDTITVTQATSQASVIGQWEPLQTLPWRPVHSIVLPTNEVMIYASTHIGRGPSLWDPSAGTLSPAPPFGYNAFCNAHVSTADGRIFFSGGTVDNLNNVGLTNADIYDPVANTFSPVPDMNAGRWYPSMVTLGNGDIVTMSGDINPGVRNLIPEVWDASNNSWRDLSDASLSLPLYPAAFLAPNGNVFVATSPSRYLDTSGAGQWTIVASRLESSRDNYGSACMYDDGKVLYSGGGDLLASAEVIDLNAATPSWRYIADMPQPRRQHNTTLLPDGRVLVTGGSSSSGFDVDDGPKPAIVWDPVADSWTTWAVEDEYRGYHSGTVLLPDGRVASIGGDGYPSLQVFSPPYLFNGPRPTIESTPAAVRPGATFFVATPDGASISAAGGQVNWLRPSAVTHTKNMNQRINRLAFTEVAGGLNVTAPDDPNISPPGDYMLFLINSSGVPSVAA